MVKVEAMEAFEEVIGYHFKNRSLLEESLTHPSVSRGSDRSGVPFNYERLEFLGDAALGLVMAEILLERYPHEKEGALAKRLAALVRGEALARVARNISMGQYIRMTIGEEAMGGRKNDNNIENALEAVMGAMYLDGGLAPVRQCIDTHWASLIDEMKDEPPKDAKTSLQEWAQAKGFPIPVYTVIHTAGPSHAPIFTVEANVAGYDPTYATGNSKKVAEREAARLMLEQVEKGGV